MEELYAEAGCKPLKTAADAGKKAGVIAAPALCFLVFAITRFYLFGIVGVLAVVGAVYLFPLLDAEYEYIFCDGQIDFDKIMGGSRRKTMAQVDFENVEAVVPESSHSANGWHDAKVRDFSSKNPQNKKYVVLCRVKEQKMKIYFEPSEKMLAAMKAKAPRKVEL